MGHKFKKYVHVQIVLRTLIWTLNNKKQNITLAPDYNTKEIDKQILVSDMVKRDLSVSTEVELRYFYSLPPYHDLKGT